MGRELELVCADVAVLSVCILTLLVVAFLDFLCVGPALDA